MRAWHQTQRQHLAERRTFYAEFVGIARGFCERFGVEQLNEQTFYALFFKAQRALDRFVEESSEAAVKKTQQTRAIEREIVRASMSISGTVAWRWPEQLWRLNPQSKQKVATRKNNLK